MVELIATSLTDGLTLIEGEGCRVSEIPTEHITWVAPLKGSDLRMPGPGETFLDGACTWIWFGPGQALVLGPVGGLGDPVAVADQSDAWVRLQLSGRSAADVLARLTPMDLRATHFCTGNTAKTLLGHVTVCLTRMSEDGFEILVPRSLAKTTLHELQRAMKSVAAKA